MPAEVSFDRESGIWTIAIRGAVDPKQVVAALTQMYESSEYRADASRLYDARESDAAMGTEDIRRLATLPLSRKSTEGARSAILVARPVTYGIARMYQVLSEGMPVEVQIFHELDLARAWLSASTLSTP